MKKLAIAFLLVGLAPAAEAALCKTLTDDGRTVFMFKLNKPTTTLSGTVSKLALCPEEKVQIVRKTVVEEYVIPNVQNRCERTAVHVCDPAFQGIKLFTNPTSTNGVIEQGCIGLTIASGTPPNGSGLYYAYPSLYSGLKQRPDGSQYCVFDK